MRTVIGLFDDHSEALSAYKALQQNGFAESDMDILTEDDRSDEPKLARIRQYVPEPDSTIYLEGVRMGGTLLTVRAKDEDVQKATQLMSGYSMVNIQERAGSWRADNAELPEMSSSGNNRNVLEVIEEDVEIGKEAVETGRMRVYTVVSEEPVDEDVTLREETIRVQRRPVDRAVTADPTLFQEKSIEVVEHGEVAQVEKVARVVEEVVVGKDVSERVETVHDTVRHQDVKVEEVKGSDVTGTRDFAAYDNDFRSYYTTNWANSGMTYAQYGPSLRYGYDLADSDAYRNKRWSDVEVNARRDWESHNPDTAWEKVKDSVQYAWEKVTGQR